MDILSGTYSCHTPDMAGVFQILRGQAGGGFARAEEVTGADGEPLIIPTGGDENAVVDAICTRPTAVDLNGDGHLDIVSGNFGGTFYLFTGTEDGEFDPDGQWLVNSKGRKLHVENHSDPFLVDWDGDGDLDLLSGSASGGVELFSNTGTAKKPSFDKSTTLVKRLAAEDLYDQSRFGDEHITGPQGSTRVFATDVNGDGKLDLLVGDNVNLLFPADGVTEEDARARLEAWDQELNKLFEKQGPDGEVDVDMDALWQARSKFLREESAGTVWLFLQK